MGVVFGLPGNIIAPVPPRGTELFQGLHMTWTGWDGSVWPLTKRRSGLILREDVEGLDTPPWEVYEQTSPGVHGSRPRGYRVQPREAFWPVLLYGDSTREWMLHDRAFWKTLQPLKYGTWTVEHPGTNERRYLRCRFDGSPQSLKFNPFRKGWTNYGVSMVADTEPFWLGDPISRRFEPDAPADFFNDGEAPVFRISSGSNMASARVTNPGDVEAWPTWIIEGPTTMVRVGLGGLQVEVPFETFEGQKVIIDTRPHMQVAHRYTERENLPDLVEEVTHLLGKADFTAIPEGENQTLDLEVVGTGTIRCSFEPRYLRAW